jgi:hypothetical protein
MFPAPFLLKLPLLNFIPCGSGTVGRWGDKGAALPIGSMLDRYGPQRLAIGGAIVFALGNFVFGLQQVHGGV